MALEVISDPRSETHRNWVSLTVIQILGGRVDHGVWVLRLRALELGGVSIALTGPGGRLFEVRVPKPGRNRVRDLTAALTGAVGALG